MASPRRPPLWTEPGDGPPPDSEPGLDPEAGPEPETIVGRAIVPPEDDDAERGPPYIDPEELAGLRPVEAQTARTVRRVLPLSEEPTALVARYLFPTERFRGEWRRHLISLAGPITLGVVASVVFGLGGGLARSYLEIPFLPSIVVLAWLVIMAWVAWQVALWHYDRFILTNKRVMKVSGIITRDVAMMPLLRVTDMKYEQTPLGRVLNYGSFVIESAGQDQALREIPQLPNPNELYLRVVEEMYDPGAVEARVDETAPEEERDPGADA